MADPTTPNRTLAVPVHGSDTDTWDQPLNANFGLLDTIAGAVVSISTTGGATALTASQAAYGTVSVTGALSSNALIIFPAVAGWWAVENLTTGNFVLIVQSVGAIEGIALPPGQISDIQINGTVTRFKNLPAVGSYLDLATSTVPSWITSCTKPPYLNCDGSTFNASTYPYLNQYLGGNTLPDLRGRTKAYLNQGTSRITNAGSGIDGETIRSAGGDQLPQFHAHSGSGNTGTENVTHTHGFTDAITQGPGGTGLASGSFSFGPSNSVTGGESNPHVHPFSFTTTTAFAGTGQNMPPTTISGICLIRAA